MTQPFGRVGPPWWGEVWVVAAGPSHKQIDPSSLAGRTVLAVNDAAFLFSPGASQPKTVSIFSADPRWVCGNRSFLEEFSGERHFALALDTWPECGGVPGAVYLQWADHDGLSDDPGALAMGGNSGYAAINLAYLKGARTIHLVGYDMHPLRGDADKFAQWAPRFRTMLPQLNAKVVRVLNHNPASAVDAFEFVEEEVCA